MNTPAHAVLNLLLLGRRKRQALLAPIAVGAILPDLPMFAFYVYQKVVLEVSEASIWAERYHDPSWQAFFDTFNSLPLLALLLFLAHRLRSPWFFALLLSMALHSVVDLFLHREDAHRHFFPLTDWRFASRVSYWDFRHYGRILAPLEAVFVLAGTVVLFLRYPSRPVRIFLGMLAAVYVLYIGYALIVWA